MFPGFLHFVWLGSRPPYAAWSNIRQWALRCDHFKDVHNDCVHPILWVDKSCLESIVQDQAYYIPYAPHIKDEGAYDLLSKQGLLVSGYIYGAHQRFIPVCMIEENLLGFQARASGNREICDALRTLGSAIAAERNYSIGGLPVLASDIFRVILMFVIGGIYVDAVGIEPRLPVITRSKIETAILSRGQISKKPEKFIRVGIIAPIFENYAMLVDTNDPHVKKVFFDILMHYAKYYENNSMRGINDRYQAYRTSHVSRNSESMAEYLHYRHEIEASLRRIPLSDVATVHSKQAPFSISSWKHQNNPSFDLSADESDDESDLFSQGPKKTKVFEKPNPLAQQKLDAYSKSQLGIYDGDSITEAGYKFLTDAIRQYYDSKGILNQAILADLLFATTPLKGHFVCSYFTPVIGRARNASAISNKFGEIFKGRKPKTPKKTSE